MPFTATGLQTSYANSMVRCFPLSPTCLNKKLLGLGNHRTFHRACHLAHSAMSSVWHQKKEKHCTFSTCLLHCTWQGQRMLNRKSICLVLSLQGLHCKSNGAAILHPWARSQACHSRVGTCKLALDACCMITSNGCRLVIVGVGLSCAGCDYCEIHDTCCLHCHTACNDSDCSAWTK